MMASTADISARVSRIFRDALNVDVSSPQADLVEGSVLDSLAFVELLSELELEFQVEIPLDGLEIESFRTTERIVDFVQGLLGGTDGPARATAPPVYVQP